MSASEPDLVLVASVPVIWDRSDQSDSERAQAAAERKVRRWQEATAIRVDRIEFAPGRLCVRAGRHFMACEARIWLAAEAA